MLYSRVACEMSGEPGFGSPACFILDDDCRREIDHHLKDWTKVAARDRVYFVQNPDRIGTLGQPSAARQIDAQVRGLRREYEQGHARRDECSERMALDPVNPL